MKNRISEFLNETNKIFTYNEKLSKYTNRQAIMTIYNFDLEALRLATCYKLLFENIIEDEHFYDSFEKFQEKYQLAFVNELFLKRHFPDEKSFQSKSDEQKYLLVFSSIYEEIMKYSPEALVSFLLIQYSHPFNKNEFILNAFSEISNSGVPYGIKIDKNLIIEDMTLFFNNVSKYIINEIK